MTHNNDNKSYLVPDYCGNRLDANEKADFESRLQEDHELLNECNDFQDFQKLYCRIDPAAPAPSDAIFDRISRKVGAHHNAERKKPIKSSPLAVSIRNFWQRIRESIAVPWMLAAAQAVVIVLLLVPAPRQDTYSTLSATEVAAHSEKTGINVVFRPNAPESDIRGLLHAIQGSVSGGPSKEGRYVVSIGSRSDLDKAVLTLKQSEIVMFAEPAY